MEIHLMFLPFRLCLLAMQEMKKSRIQPGVTAYSGVIAACGRQGMLGLFCFLKDLSGERNLYIF